VDVAREFRQLIADPAGALLATDYDGTLAPIVDDPQTATPTDGVVELLAELAEYLGHIAVITGRPVREAVRLGALDRVAGLTILGLYGEQRWHGGVESAGPGPPGLAAATDEIRELLAVASPGVFIEDKGGSLAVHTRRAADPHGEIARLSAPLTAIAAAHDLRLEPGRLVLELRRSGVDKGFALSGLVAAHRPSSVLYLGDDLGDLPAFRMIAHLRAQGVPAWSVAVASDEVPAVVGATDFVVQGTEGAAAVFADLLAALRDSA
jgi:trehalose 6-phosphate phosphatase